ncbi:hypothetical protein M8J77_019012 [Diaphorina citri]|nr:hypothetical protein M8J77_019012 [Diaphorina citri]
MRRGDINLEAYEDRVLWRRTIDEAMERLRFVMPQEYVSKKSKLMVFIFWIHKSFLYLMCPHIENSIVRFTTMLTEPILSHESEYPFPVVPTVLKLAGQGTSDSADSRARLVLYEPAHSGSITHLVDTIDRHHIGTKSSPEISIQQQNG